MVGYGRRKKGTRRPHKVFVIVCEGKKTERIYFNNYKKRGCNLKIEMLYSGDTDPLGLIEFAKKQISKYELNLKGGDAIWCVFDCNGNKDKIISTACKNAGHNVKIILSNPSFELWFLLHFEYYSTKLTNSDLIDRLERHLPDYKKSKDYYDLLKSKRENAVDNAKRLNELHQINGINLISVDSNPSTQVFTIVEEILKITK